MQSKALEVLNVYLTESPVSVLQKEFVEIEDPLCTGKIGKDRHSDRPTYRSFPTDVDFHATDHLKTTIMLTASNVPLEEMEGFPEQLFATFKRLVDQDDIDMDRMKNIIDKEMLKVCSKYIE